MNDLEILEAMKKLARRLHQEGRVAASVLKPLFEGLGLCELALKCPSLKDWGKDLRWTKRGTKR